MSKSKGNTISPDEYIEQYGSDVFRMYLMFGFSYVEGGAWNDEGIKAIDRFLDRVERLVNRTIELRAEDATGNMGRNESELNYARHFAIKGVTEDADKFQFNTAIARIMELVNALYKYDSDVKIKNVELFEDIVADLLRIMAPFAPHFTEEMWERLGYEYSIFNQKWPQYDPNALVKDVVEMGIQINGKVKGRIEVPSDASQEEIEKLVLADEKVQSYIGGKEVKKVIVIKNRIVNIVVK